MTNFPRIARPLLRGSLAAAAFCSLLPAQGLQFDRSAPATLGQSTSLDFSGATPNKTMAFALSFNDGPTPLKLMFGGNDPRQLSVGVDLISLWVFTVTGTGAGKFNLPVPNNSAFQGMRIHLQLLTGPGPSGQVVDQVSNALAIQLGGSNTATTLKARLGDGQATPTGRALAASQPIAGSPGEFLLIGGGTGNILGATGLQSTEIFASRDLSVRPGPKMLAPRALNTTTLLKDGRILIAGGVNTLGNPVATAEIYDPKTNSFSATGSMTVARAGHGAALLSDGRVLVAAGTKELADLTKLISGLLKSAEIFDPATGKWTATGSIGNSVLAPALTTLKNGKVLVSGGAKITRGLFNIPVSVDTVNRCQLFDPATGQWSSTGNMINDRAVHATNTILLSDGRVLVTGGVEVKIGLLPPPTTFAGAKAMSGCEIYNPTTGSWTLMPALAGTRTGHSVVQLPSGLVQIAGGASGALDAAVSSDQVQVLDPSKGSFVATFKLRAARATHAPLLLPDGTVVLLGGSGATTSPAPLRSIERIHP